MGSAREGFALWSTGLSASGKTTLAKAVERELIERGIHNVQRLDGAVVRQDLTRGGSESGLCSRISEPGGIVVSAAS